MIRGLVFCALLIVGGAVSARAQVTIQLRDAGAGRGPELLMEALRGKYVVIEPSPDTVRIGHDSVLAVTTIVLGRDVYLDGTVHGDLIVIGGDLYMHPGALVEGRAITYDGGLYESTLAHVNGGMESFRDVTYDIERVPGGYALTYRPLVTQAPNVLARFGPISPRLPTYDRSNGLSIPLAAVFEPLRGAIELTPQITYRSQLGKFDPGLTATYFATHQTAVGVSIEHGTFTNEGWIWSDLVNSLETIVVGDDARNWYRATRGEALGTRTLTWSASTLALWAGGRWERAYDVRPDTGATGGPWSLFGRHDFDDMLRPNPRIDPGSIASILGRARFDWRAADIRARLNADVEFARFGPRCDSCVVHDATGFAQGTIDGHIEFPTFGSQTLSMDGHAVVTRFGTTPRQRWAYLGGPGTIPTLDMLSRGGDELVFVDGRYNVPINRVKLPFVGSPVVTLREVIGGADVRRMPSLAQATGLRVSVGLLHVEWMVDPVHHHSTFLAGLSVAR